MSREENTEGERGKEKQRNVIKVQKANSVIRQKVSVLILLVLPHGRQRTFLPGLLDLVGSCRSELIGDRCC